MVASNPRTAAVCRDKDTKTAHSAARKMMKFGKWLDEIEKIKYVGRKLMTGAPDWNPWLTAVEGISHVLSMGYYLCDNVVFMSQASSPALYPSPLHLLHQLSRSPPGVWLGL
jgi:hypothetical protein